MLRIAQIKETCIYVTDLQRTRAFYGDTLGLELIALAEGRHVFFRAGSSVLLCFLAEVTRKGIDLPAHGATGSIHFAFEIENGHYESALAFIATNGIEVIHQQEWKKGKRSFYFHDPDGHLVEIVEKGIWD
ncbi:MAG TPA: VOC family protein [Chitinophagaceae bacterium]